MLITQEWSRSTDSIFCKGSSSGLRIGGKEKAAMFEATVDGAELKFYGETETPRAVVQAIYDSPDFFGDKLPLKTVREILSFERRLVSDTKARLVYVSLFCLVPLLAFFV
jgi:hypothetical protein